MSIKRWWKKIKSYVSRVPGNPESSGGADSWFEGLEQRKLLSASLEAGVLTVVGTPGNDRVVIVAGAQPGEVKVRGSVEDARGDYTGVNEVVVQAGAGNDRVKVKGQVRDTSGRVIGLVIEGGDGKDRLIGGAGDDVIDGGDGNDRIKGKQGDDTILGGDGEDRLVGNAGDDMIDAGPGDDKAKGGSGDDTMIGGPGSDRMDGQRGIDTVGYDSSDRGVVVSLAKGRAEDDGFGSSDPRLRGIENVIGSPHDDRLEGDGRDNVLDGGDGEDVIDGGDGEDTTDGEHGEDVPDGGGDDDTILPSDPVDSEPLLLDAWLANDTGTADNDGVTWDWTITGTLSDESPITTFAAALDIAGPADYQDVRGTLGTDGSFTLTTERLESINRGPLSAGEHVLHLLAADSLGHSTRLDVHFVHGHIQTHHLTVPDSARFAQFGFDVDVSDGIVIVGQPGDDHAGRSSGSAYLYDAVTGDNLHTLRSEDPAGDEFFGSTVGISGNLAVVGAAGDGHAGGFSGAVYVYDVTTGEQLYKLTAPDADANHLFGRYVSIDGEDVIVGAPFDDDVEGDAGAVYLFNAVTGAFRSKLTASDAGANDNFGRSVSISEGLAIVGSPFDDDAGDLSGAAYVFDVATGDQLLKLTASDAGAGDWFGDSVSISGTTAIVGARFGDGDSGDTGAAYLFDVSTGDQLFKLTSSDQAAFDFFGVSVSISGSTAIVGADSNDDRGVSTGSAYLFDVDTGVELFKLTASDAASNAHFGSTVAIDGHTMSVGAFGHERSAGAAYVYRVG